MTEVSLNTNSNINQYNFPDFHKYDNQILFMPKNSKDKFETSTNDKHNMKLGVGIAASALGMTALVFMLTKGLPQNTVDILKKYIEKLEDKINIRKSQQHAGVITTLYTKILKRLNSSLDRATSINNFTSLKDMLFGNIMGKTSITKKIHSGITNLFEKISKSTVDREYNKLDNKFTNLFTRFGSIFSKVDLNKTYTVNGISKTGAEWAQIIAEKQNKIVTKYTKVFGVDARIQRYQKMKDCNVGLDKKVWADTLNGLQKGQTTNEKISCIKNSQVHQSFIAQELLEKDKTDLIKEVLKARDIITHDIADNYKISKNLLNTIFNSLAVDDVEANKLVKSLKTKLVLYSKLKGAEEQKLRLKLTEEIKKELELLKQSFNSGVKKYGYDETTVSQVSSAISDLEKALTENGGKGQLQKILTIYKAILPRKEYSKIKKEVYSVIKRFDGAIDVENNKFFDKLRDLNLGSAPTDVLTLLGSIGGVGIGLLNAKNSDERKSALLKYGIPVIGGIATTLVLTVRLTAGFKSLALGFLSSAVMNRIGTGIDKHIKQMKKIQIDKEQEQNLKDNINNL